MKSLREKKRVVLVLVLLIIATDVVLSNLPSPTPTSAAISNAEHNQSFTSIVNSANASYSYMGYSKDPAWSTQCVASVIGEVAHYFSPFHEYFTTSLIFFVEPVEQVASNGAVPIAQTIFLLFVQINPTTGQINSIQRGNFCA